VAWSSDSSSSSCKEYDKKRLWQQLHQWETIWKTASQVKWAKGQNQTHGGLVQIEVPDPYHPMKQNNGIYEGHLGTSMSR